MKGLSQFPPQPQMQMQYQIRDDIPAFTVTEKRGFFDDLDHLWPQGSMIYWEGELNPGLDPLNELAEEKMREYLMMLDKKADEVAALKGTGHASIVQAYTARRLLQEMDRKKGYSATEEEELPIMRGKRYGKRMAMAINDPKAIPMMGHQARGSAVTKQAKGTERKSDKVD